MARSFRQTVKGLSTKHVKLHVVREGVVKIKCNVTNIFSIPIKVDILLSVVIMFSSDSLGKIMLQGILYRHMSFVHVGSTLNNISTRYQQEILNSL